MPWFRDENGDPKYAASIFTTEELPTWNEMYNEWWKNKIFSSNVDLGLDTYYNTIPRSKVLMAQACNQLNKMLYEDGVLEKKCSYGIYVYFILSGKEMQTFRVDKSRKDQIPIVTLEDIEIYDIPNPNKFYIENPFKIVGKDYTHKDITDAEFNDFCGIHAVFNDPVKCIEIPLYKLNSENQNNSDFIMKLITDLLSEMKTYFEGKPGWKDANGNNIEGSNDKQLDCVSGYDPAL